MRMRRSSRDTNVQYQVDDSSSLLHSVEPRVSSIAQPVVPVCNKINVKSSVPVAISLAVVI